MSFATSDDKNHTWPQNKKALFRYSIYLAAYFPAWFIVLLVAPKFETSFDALRQRGELFAAAEWMHGFSQSGQGIAMTLTLLVFSAMIGFDILLEQKLRAEQRVALIRSWSYLIITIGIAVSGLAGILLLTTVQRAASYL